jgi:hypothetical protein
MEGNLKSRGSRLMVLKGLDEGTFVKEAKASGLPGKLSNPFYKASRGSPMALEYLKEMDSSILEGLGSLDIEAAVMSLILGLRSRL